MNLGQLLEYLDKRTGQDFLDGSADESITKARTAEHASAFAGELIKAIADGCDCSDAGCELERSSVVNALGPARLKYQGDEAPAEDFRAMRDVVLAVDEAFDEEALRAREQG